MRVLLGHCFYRSSAPSGEDSVYRNEKKLLESNGFEVICFEKFNDELNDETLYKKSLSGLNFIWSQSAYQEISALIKKTKPDLAHFHNIFPQISTSAYSACQKLGVPVVQTLHNFRYICPNGLLQRGGKPCEKCIDGSLVNSLIHRCYRNSLIATLPMAAMISFNRMTNKFDHGVNKYIALTDFAKERFIRAGFDPSKIAVKPNFVDAISKQHFSLGEYAIYVGRLTAEKGVINLIEACKQTKHIPMKIVGDGELRSLLESASIQYGLNIEFLGFQKKETVIQLVKNSRYVVLPSECYEGFPVTIAEAFACGKPVIGTRIGSINEIIEEGVTGKKFEFGSCTALATCMSELWDNSQEVEYLSGNARAAYENRYTAEANFRHLEFIYQNVIHRDREL